jgi:hypothetical protein
VADDADRIPHRCARNGRCADREKVNVIPKVCDECECHSHGLDHPCSVEGGCGHLHKERIETLGARIAAPEGLCAVCAGRVEQDIAHLPGDVAELTVLLAATGSGGGNGGKVRSTPTPPVPIRVGIEAVRAEIDHELQCWAEPVAEALGIDWDTNAQQHSRLGVRVQKAARLLASAVPTLLALPAQEHMAWDDGEPVWDDDGWHDTVTRDGISGALHLMELHRRVFSVAGRTRLVHRLTGPCPWCSQRTLTRENGADVVRCESDQCRGRAVPERYYDWLAAVVTAEEKRQRDKAA